jgi:hypothetical protein
VLSVIADGPSKSFAFRRLQYLSGKFTMHTMLNEFQELASMKVPKATDIPLRLVLQPHFNSKCHIGKR